MSSGDGGKQEGSRLSQEQQKEEEARSWVPSVAEMWMKGPSPPAPVVDSVFMLCHGSGVLPPPHPNLSLGILSILHCVPIWMLRSPWNALLLRCPFLLPLP